MIEAIPSRELHWAQTRRGMSLIWTNQRAVVGRAITFALNAAITHERSAMERREDKRLPR
jgi:hypothetical protein